MVKINYQLKLIFPVYILAVRSIFGLKKKKGPAFLTEIGLVGKQRRR